MYSTEVGILLNTTLHKAYDALRWSLYERVSGILVFFTIDLSLEADFGQDGVYYVHFLLPPLASDNTMGKKSLSPVSMPNLDPQTPPSLPGIMLKPYACEYEGSRQG